MTNDVVAVTMAVDVQKNRLEYQVMLHTESDKRQIIEHDRIATLADKDAAWVKLSEVIKRINPDMTFIDVGYDPNFIDSHIVRTVRSKYPWSTAIWRSRIKLTMGSRSATSQKPSFIDRESKNGDLLYDVMLGTHQAKLYVIESIVMGDISIIGSRVPQDFHKQLTNEELRFVDKKGKRGEQVLKWHTKGRNEAFDCAYMNVCARAYLPSYGARRRSKAKLNALIGIVEEASETPGSETPEGVS